MLAQLVLQRRPQNARLDARGLRPLIDLEHPVERAHVQRHGGPVEARLDAADDARAAAEGDQRDLLGRAPVDDPCDVVLVARARDQVGRMVIAAAEGFDQVPVRLAACVGDALIRVVREQ